MAEVRESGIRVPRGLLYGALALIVFTIAAIYAGRATHSGLIEVSPVREVEGRDLMFKALSDGTMRVTGEGGDPVATLVVEGDSFAITAVQGLALQRPDDATASGYRLRLSRGQDGRMDIADPETGRTLPLVGFGPDNIRAFGHYLDR